MSAVASQGEGFLAAVSTPDGSLMGLRDTWGDQLSACPLTPSEDSQWPRREQTGRLLHVYRLNLRAG
jgi:hypothetical protein